jgi:hypothetical protein
MGGGTHATSMQVGTLQDQHRGVGDQLLPMLIEQLHSAVAATERAVHPLKPACSSVCAIAVCEVGL